MTREESIYKLEQTKRYSKYLSDDEIAAIVVAIKALEQEPCDDYISRQAVIDAFWKLNVELSPTAIWTIQNMVKDVPSVTPQQRTGRWILHPNGIYAHLICDKCLSCAPYGCKINYCPSCGAKMEVEE